jgi:murein DD-endopeptidase MepM/ murein hydrolase activator NlpD
MSKKYTFMFFSTDKLGKVHTVTISRRFIVFSFALILATASALGVSLYQINLLHNEKIMLSSSDNENAALKAQLTQYTQQIEEITKKMSAIDDLEFRIKDLVTLQTGNTPLKPIAVGGKEVDLLRGYSSAASLSENEFFSTLDDTLQQLSYEVEQRGLNLSDLASALEEKRLVMLYTPTLWPVNGWLSSHFGYRLSPFTGRQTFHEGVDIAARHGTDVRSTGKGLVVFAGPKSGYGNLVTINHGYGYITRYGHNSSLEVKVGDKVEKGDLIAKVGSSGRSTGTHLHYEVLVNGIPVNPLKFIIEDQVGLAN